MSIIVMKSKKYGVYDNKKTKKHRFIKRSSKTAVKSNA